MLKLTRNPLFIYWTCLFFTHVFASSCVCSDSNDEKIEEKPFHFDQPMGVLESIHMTTVIEQLKYMNENGYDVDPKVRIKDNISRLQRTIDNDKKEIKVNKEEIKDLKEKNVNVVNIIRYIINLNMRSQKCIRIL